MEPSLWNDFHRRWQIQEHPRRDSNQDTQPKKEVALLTLR